MMLKSKILLSLSILFATFTLSSKEIVHSQTTITYPKEAISKYESSKTWPYITKFLTPYFLPQLENHQNQKVLDAGCGVGLWSIHAAQHGAEVYGIDIQKGMIELARQEADKEHLDNKVNFEIGSVANLPYESDFFDFALSINVACNLDSIDFESHFSELYRTLKSNGNAVITVPTSLDIVFTNGHVSSTEAKKHIQSLLNNLEDNPDNAKIEKTLNQLDEVLSATFTIKDNRLILITNLKELEENQQIWRKLPNLAIPNRYHSEKAYMNALHNSNLILEKITHPQFDSEKERLSYISTLSKDTWLGPEYTNNPAFSIYYIRKPTNFAFSEVGQKIHNFFSHMKSTK